MAVGGWSGWSLGPIQPADPPKCVTFDEIAHITAGYTYWDTGSIRLQPENGILPQRWVSFLLWLDDSISSPVAAQEPWQISNVWHVGYYFFYKQGNSWPTILLLSRASMATFSLAIGLLIFLWSKRLFGWAGGLVSLTLFAFCPLMLSHGALATSDAFAAFFFIALVGAWWRQQQQLTLGRWLVSALAAAGLAMSKFSAPMAVFMILILMGLGLLDRRPLVVSLAGWTRTLAKRWQRLIAWTLSMITQLILVILLIWTAYGFRYSPFEPGESATYAMDWTLALERPNLSSKVVDWVRRSHLLPESYVYGQAYVLHQAQARSAFLNGEYRTTGWWWFFPFAMLIKTPLAIFALLALALAAVVQRWRQTAIAINGPPWSQIGQSLWRTAPLWVLACVYMGFALTSHLNIGLRHVMPIYPVLYILAGSVGLWFVRRQKLGIVLTLLGLGWLIGASLAIRPHHLAYFNELVGGPSQGYRHLADSSIDWGQDLPGLKKWIQDNQLDPRQALETSRSAKMPFEPVYVSYFGTGSPHHHEIPALILPGSGYVNEPFYQPLYELRAGYYAVSVSILTGTYAFPPGPWSPENEVLWLQYKSRWQQMATILTDPIAARAQLDTDEKKQKAFMLREAYNRALVARLCSYLRSLEPIHQIGYSINIYRLTDQDLDQALNHPTPELVRAQQQQAEQWRRSSNQ